MKRKLLSYLKVVLSCFLGVVAFTSANGQCVVTNASDGAEPLTPGSIRQVIDQCPANGTVTFNLPPGTRITLATDDGNWYTKSLGVNKNLTIDGATTDPNRPIIIDGNNHDIFSIGWYDGPGTSPITALTIKNLILVGGDSTPALGLPNPQVSGISSAISIGDILPVSNVTIDNCYIGYNPITNTVERNTGHGIVVINAPGNQNISNVNITNSVISGNSQNGIQLDGVIGGLISNNKIGTNSSGTACVDTPSPFEENNQGGNGYDGVNITSSNGITIKDNVISCNGSGEIASSYNGKRGIYLQESDNNILIGNKIGTDIDGSKPLPNYKSGILISQGSDNNIIGGVLLSERNIISGNGLETTNYASIQDKHGIVIDWGSGTPSTQNQLLGNYIGLSADGECLPNSKNGIEIIGNGSGNIIGGLIAGSENYIGCNGENGVSIGMGSSTNTIQNNYIGTDGDGKDLGNKNNGILFSSAGNGGTILDKELKDNIIKDNVIGFNKANGIQTFGPKEIDGIEIKGNYIGILPGAINKAIPNGIDGILIQTDLTGVEIGGIGANEGNFISNNAGIGINIAPENHSIVGTGSVIVNNYIGVGTDGISPAGNGGTGITINSDVQGLTIGGTVANTKNIIAGNGGDGIFITGTNTSDINVEGNKLGVDINGDALANTGYGVQVDNVSGTVDIGGAAGNTIYGNTAGGILVKGTTTNPITNIQNNTIGNTAIASNGNAITIEGGLNTIRENEIFNYVGNGVNITKGLSTLTDNDIYDNTVGVYLSGSTATGNIIGTAAAGNNIHENRSHGIALSLGANTNTISNNQIGKDGANGENGIHLDGATANTITAGNVIVNHNATGQYGIYISISSNTNTVAGNFVGTDASNTAGLGNENGIMIDGSANNIIGGTAAADKNIIAGNNQNGLIVQGSGSTGNQVQGNNIGIDATETVLANGANGIIIQTGATGNTIGGTDPGASNTISGNTSAGIQISSANNNNVLGNKIGTNTAGDAAIANGTDGINVNASTANKLDGNLIGGNGANGIALNTGANNNTLTNNSIGSNTTGTIISNTNNGILVSASTGNKIGTSAADGNTISGNTESGIRFENGGATNTVLSNTIANNLTNGIQVDDATSVGNTFSQNSMFCNAGMGILETSGGNNVFLQTQLDDVDNRPEIFASSRIRGTFAMVTGLNGAKVEVFKKDDEGCDDCVSRTKDGKEFITDGTVDASGKYDIALPSYIIDDSASYIITVTSTTGSTSEFSLCSTIKCIKPDVTITPITPAPVCFGDSVKLAALGGPKGNDGAMFTWYEASDLLTPLNGLEIVNDSIFYAKISGDYLVTVRNGSCDSTSDAVKAIVSPPVNLVFTVEASDSCETDGALLITGLDATTSYTLSYKDPVLKTVTLPSGSTSQRVPLPVLAGGASYTDIILDSAGCKSDPETAIITGQTPEILAADKIDISVCAGTGSISIGEVIGTSYSVTYDYKSATAPLITVGPSTIVPNLNDSLVINNLKAGDYSNIIIINDATNCESTVPTITIDPFSINIDPTVIGSDSVCFGDQVSFAAPANTGAMFEWYSVPATGVISGAPIADGIDQNTYDPTTNGTYRLVVSLLGCSDTSGIAYAYVAAPQNYTVVIEQEDSCNTGAAILISGLDPGFSPYIVNYTSTAGAVGPLNLAANASGEISIAIAAPENITALSVDSAGCIYTDIPGLANEYSISAPIKTVTPISLCNANDGEIEFSGLDNGTYDFSFAKFPAAAVISSEVVSGGTPTIIKSGLAPGDYITTIKRNNCTFTFRDTLDNPGEPVISVVATDPSQCGGNGTIEITITNTTDNYDVYYNGVQELSNQSGSPLTITKPAGDYNNISVNITGATCPSNDTSVVLKDPGKPKFGVKLNNPTLCNTANGSIDINGLVSGRSYTIDYLMGGTAQTQVSGIGPIITIPNLIDTIYSNIRVTDVLTLCDSMQVGPFELKDPPIPTFALSRVNPSTCGADGQLILKNFTPNASAYQLTYYNPAVVGPVSITPIGGTYSIPLPAGEYTNVVISLNNCFSLPADTAIRNPVEVPQVHLAAPTQLCEGDMANFTATPIMAGGASPTYAWTVNGVSVPGAGPTLAVSDLPVGNNIQVKVVMTSSSACADPLKLTHEATRSVNVTARPIAAITGTTKICDGQNATLLASGGVNGSKYQWYRDGQPLSNTNASKINASIPGLYTVEISNGVNCSDISDPHLLEVISVKVYAGADKDVKTPGEVFTFPLEGISNGNNPRWNLIEGSGTITNPQLLNSPASLGIGINKLMLTDSVGSCIATDEVIIRVRGQIWIPTAISPNGDGSNDAWFISGLESYDKYTIRVYNRYGNKVFESKNSYIPWDGTRNGEPMPVATYYYVIEVQDDKNYQGPLTIMR